MFGNARVGASPSTLNGPAAFVALLSALSTASPVTVWLCPSDCGFVQVAIPEAAAPGSAHVNVTVTALLYQPLDPRVPVGEAEIVGLVLSSLILTESVPTLPALSSADPFTICSAVSVLTRTSGVIVAVSTPDPPTSSVAVKWTVVSTLFHPKAFAS